MLKISVSFILLMLILAGGGLWYVGYFNPIQITVENSDSYRLVYEKMQGDYAQTSKVSDRIYYWLLGNDIKATKGFGMYFDNPKRTKKKDLRSIAGCILEDAYADKVKIIQSTFFVKDFPAQQCLKVVLPWENKLSILVGILKVYPSVAKYAKQNGYADKYQASLEVYDMENKMIVYLFPVDSDTVLLDTYYNATN